MALKAEQNRARHAKWHWLRKPVSSLCHEYQTRLTKIQCRSSQSGTHQNCKVKVQECRTRPPKCTREHQLLGIEPKFFFLPEIKPTVGQNWTTRAYKFLVPKLSTNGEEMAQEWNWRDAHKERSRAYHRRHRITHDSAGGKIAQFQKNQIGRKNTPNFWEELTDIFFSSAN